MKRGLFITFEGGEGSGKSTQIKEVAKFLKRAGYKVETFREPGSTKTGEAIREVLLNPKLKSMTRQTELLLFLAARAQLVREKIMPALKKGRAVLLDRFEDSTLAYQGYGRGLDMKKISSFFPFVRENLTPDATILLYVPVAVGLKRAAKRGRADRMEKSARGFHERLLKGYLDLARKNPRRIFKVQSDRDIPAVKADILKVVRHVLRK